MASQSVLYDKIRSEADVLFNSCDPSGEVFTALGVDITRCFLAECLRYHDLFVRNVHTPV